MIVSALMSTSEFAEPDNAEREQRNGNGRVPPTRAERDAEQRDPEPEIGGEPAARREDERHEAADEAADPEGGVEVTDAPLADVEELERRDDHESTLSAPATSVWAV